MAGAVVRILPLGDRAMLVELASLARVLAFDAMLRANPIEGVTQVVPAARTVALHVDPSRVDAAALSPQLRELARTTASPVEQGTVDAPVEIPVNYDGFDLDLVADDLGATPAEVAELHSGIEYTVAFNGFSPGFPYLAGLPAALHLPRLASPRARVPRGSVAIAGEFCGIYPTPSPGGWRLIGHTSVPLWDSGAAVPPLLPRGTRVRFVPRMSAAQPAGEPSSLTQALLPPAISAEVRGSGAGAGNDSGVPPVLTVVDPGPLTVIEDGGRPGRLGWAVSPGGAADPGSLHAANRLVGNAPASAALETVGGISLSARRRTVVAVSGARGRVTVNGAEADPARPLLLVPGDSLHLAMPAMGARIYVAVRGGVAVPRVLDSRSFDALSDLGPRPLRPGDDVASAGRAPFSVAEEAVPTGPYPAPGDLVTLRISPGPRANWFTRHAWELLTGREWEVTPESNRVGVRLRGEEPLPRADRYADAELASEGLVAGAIQVPPSGAPLVFGTNHPTTGGYPVIACVATTDLPRIGQLPAGARVRFEPSAISFVQPGA
ncbi:urea amidolyase family protein [Rarobacter faecitabidus]|uniref:5-oxoprolinase subunit B/C family protein n=1 Tax=Rarobacter faecitabidus TaxID=13243 RepID=UPI001476DB20|nr:urea amidolyase family protein [Rarobacter faecitabidus]